MEKNEKGEYLAKDDFNTDDIVKGLLFLDQVKINKNHFPKIDVIRYGDKIPNHILN